MKYLPLVALVAGTIAGGSLLGSAVAAASYLLAPLDTVRLGGALGVASLAVAGVVWPRLRPWLPERACQVPEALLLTERPERTAMRWGVELGLGVRTFVVTPAMYGLLAVAVSQEHWLTGGFVCVVYGAARGGIITGFALRRAHRYTSDHGTVPGVGLAQTLRAPLASAVIVAAALAAVRA